MTPRERLLAILRKESEIDRAGWSPLIDGYYMSSFPPGTDVLEVFREIGADVMERHVHTWRGSVEDQRDPAVIQKLRRDGEATYESNGVTTTILVSKTEQGTEVTEHQAIPGRTLTSRSVYTATSPFLPFPIEHPVKDIDDLKAFEEIVRSESFERDFEHFTAEDTRIGDDGIATDSVPTSPIQRLLQHTIGVAQYYTVFYMDYPEDLDSVLATMHEKNCELYELISVSPADVVIDYENTSTTLISPDLYRKYSLPMINDYADILHRHDKVFLTHRCGKLSGLVDLMRQGKDDGIVDISPEPTGDLDLWTAKEALPDKIVMGGLDATFLSGWTPEQVRAYTREIITRCGGPERLIIGSADAVPQNARLENLQAVTREIEG